MFSCLTLELEATNGRESSAGIGQDRLNCNGGERPEHPLGWVSALQGSGVHHIHTVLLLGRSCLVAVCDNEVPPWRILGRKVEGEHLESQPLSKLK